MGGKYRVRTDEKRTFGDTSDYYVNTLFAFLKLTVSKRSKIIFIQINF